MASILLLAASMPNITLPVLAKTLLPKQQKKVLKARNQLIIEYLRLLRQRFADTTQVGNYAQNVIYLDLETQINWFLNWEKGIDALESPRELNTSSENWQKYWENVLEKVKAAKKKSSVSDWKNFNFKPKA